VRDSHLAMTVFFMQSDNLHFVSASTRTQSYFDDHTAPNKYCSPGQQLPLQNVRRRTMI
jgi:hypothetical protein